MKIVLLQTDITWANPPRNAEEAEKLMSSCPGADLYVLPEMFSTGFCVHPEGVAETDGGCSLQWMKAYARAHDCAVAGSLSVEEDGHYYNRFYFVFPDGTFRHYDKRHLFSFGGEDRSYEAGRERVVVDFRGMRILMQVCYDLRFPVWARNKGDYDMILYVANWPVQRMGVWHTLLHARAIENQCYVAGVNRVGSDPYCRYNGGTMLIDAYGRDMASCRSDIPDAVMADVSLDVLEDFRHKFPVLRDGDDFTCPPFNC